MIATAGVCGQRSSSTVVLLAASQTVKCHLHIPHSTSPIHRHEGATLPQITSEGWQLLQQKEEVQELLVPQSIERLDAASPLDSCPIVALLLLIVDCWTTDLLSVRWMTVDNTERHALGNDAATSSRA